MFLPSFSKTEARSRTSITIKGVMFLAFSEIILVFIWEFESTQEIAIVNIIVKNNRTLF
jgi:hypothetical protein